MQQVWGPLRSLRNSGGAKVQLQGLSIFLWRMCRWRAWSDGWWRRKRFIGHPVLCSLWREMWWWGWCISIDGWLRFALEMLLLVHFMDFPLFSHVSAMFVWRQVAPTTPYHKETLQAAATTARSLRGFKCSHCGRSEDPPDSGNAKQLTLLRSKVTAVLKGEYLCAGCGTSKGSEAPSKGYTAEAP